MARWRRGASEGRCSYKHCCVGLAIPINSVQHGYSLLLFQLVAARSSEVIRRRIKAAAV